MLIGIFGGDGTPDPPKISQARYVLQTDSRIYYMREFSENSATITINGYYELYRGKWRFNDGELTFSRKAYRNITVIERRAS